MPRRAWRAASLFCTNVPLLPTASDRDDAQCERAPAHAKPSSQPRPLLALRPAPSFLRVHLVPSSLPFLTETTLPPEVLEQGEQSARKQPGIPSSQRATGRHPAPRSEVMCNLGLPGFVAPLVAPLQELADRRLQSFHSPALSSLWLDKGKV